MCFLRKKNSKNYLSFSMPAKDFENALPSGNSHNAVFVMGGVRVEKILVQTDSFCLPKSQNKNLISNMLDAKSNISQIKKNLSKLNGKVAQNVISGALLSKGFEENFCEYFSLCQLVLNFHENAFPSNYSRSLNLESGVCKVSFDLPEGEESRACFVSNEGVICHKTHKSKPFSMEITISSLKNTSTLRFDKSIFAEKNYITFYYNADGKFFGIVCYIFAEGGETFVGDTFVKVKNALSVYIFAKTFSNVTNIDDEIARIKKQIKLSASSFEKMEKEKEKELCAAIGKISLQITKDKLMPVENELLSLRQNRLSLPLLQKLYSYGKYLSYSLHSLAMSRDSLVDISKREDRFFNFEQENDDIVMSSRNYLKKLRLLFFCVQNGNCDEIKNYLMSIFSKLDDYKTNARFLYNCDGIFIPSVEESFGGQIGSAKADVILNKNVMPYVFSLICDYYKQTCDIEFMKNYGYEIAKNIGLFYLSFLKIDRTSNMLESPFGISPFSKPKGKDYMIALNPAVDFESARYIFAILSNMAKEFEDENASKKYLNALTMLPAVQVDKDGLIKEYNTATFESESTSPYIAHLFPYNIGRRMTNSSRDYDLLVSNSLKSKYISAYGKFGAREVADMALALATCGEGADAFCLLEVLCKFFIKDNLLFSSIDRSNFGVGAGEGRDFVNIDINTSLCAILQNMFLTSQGDCVYLFRSLPKVFGKVNIKSISLSASLSLSMQINNKKGIAKLVFVSKEAQKINLFLPSSYKKHKGEGEIDRQNLVLKNIFLQKGKALKVKIFY